MAGNVFWLYIKCACLFYIITQLNPRPLLAAGRLKTFIDHLLKVWSRQNTRAIRPIIQELSSKSQQQTLKSFLKTSFKLQIQFTWY